MMLKALIVSLMAIASLQVAMAASLAHKEDNACSSLVDPDHGTVTVKGYGSDAKAHYECDNGYKIVGSRYRTCQYDGSWSGEAPICTPTRCPDLSDPANGHVVVKGYTPGSESHYECDEGYKLLGVVYRRCQDDCTWSAKAPTCEQTRCPILEAPAYGKVVATGNIVGSTTHYRCIDGYKLEGKPYRTCHYDGLWDGVAPTCRPSRCPELDAPEYGEVNVPDSRSPGESAHYSCIKGYKLVGEAYRTCQEDCEWSGDEPVCIPIVCPRHPAPQYGSVEFTGYTPSSRADYRCDDGYKLIGDQYRICGYDGIWGGHFPTCIPATCPSLSSPAYGEVEVPTNRAPGARAHYSCLKGYKLVGDQYRTCQDDCEWTGEPPQCIQIKCTRHSAPEYGSVRYTELIPGSRVEYECNYGYKLVGVSYRTCNYLGQWEGELPKCIPSKCPELDDPEYGSVHIPDYSLGSRAFYKCDKGYKLVGDDYRTCQEDCTWSSKPPQCILIMCPEHDGPVDGSVVYTGYTPTSKATYKCDEGYKLEGVDYRICGYDGVWSGELPACTPSRCPELTAPLYGRVNVPDTLSPGARAHYSCEKGYKIVGDKYRTCGYNCEWSGVLPECIPITCPRHTAPQYGSVIYTGYRPRSTVHYRCHRGYKLVGHTYRKCDYYGEWSGDLPECIPSRCSELDAPQYGIVEVPYYTPGSRAHYACEKGYKLVGDAYRTCQSDCEWSGEHPKCIAITCPKHDAPQYGIVRFTDYNIHSRVTYECQDGYKLVGLNYRTCGYDGTWSGEVPTCRPSRCRELYTPKHSMIDVADYTPGSRAQYSCVDGYKLVGDAYRTCQDDCEWSGEPPTCVLIRCPHVDAPNYGSVEFHGYSVGGTIEYSCTYGFRLVGEATRTCQYNEQWSGEAPVCELITCPQLYAPEYGQVHTTSNKVASRAQYKCDYGYELVGEATRRCLDTGKWSGEEPVCKSI